MPALSVRLLSLLCTAGLVLAQDAKPDDAKPAGKIDFATRIWPILEANCVKCHKAPHVDASGKQRKPKGGVVLDTKAGIKDGKKGKLVIAKKPDDSKLIQAISLPADDEDRMPPAKEGDPLPKEKIDLLKKWIEEGAEFGTWTGAAEQGKDKQGDGDKAKGADKPKDGEKREGHEEELARVAGDLLPADAATIERVAMVAHAHVQPVTEGSALLRVTFLGSEALVDDAAIAALSPLRDRIAEISLARTHVTDAGATALAAMPRLLHVDLRQTQVGDAGVTALAQAPQLRSLNLFGTKVADLGVAALAGAVHLRELWLWQTPASAQAAVALQRQKPAARIVFAADLPEPIADEAPRGGRRGAR